MTPLILKRAPIGDNQDDYDVLEDGVVEGRIFKAQVAPAGRQWMWASGHNRRAAHGYEPTRVKLCDRGVREKLATGKPNFWVRALPAVFNPALPGPQRQDPPNRRPWAARASSPGFPS